MGQWKDSHGVDCFSPDDTQDKMYIDSDYCSQGFSYLLEKAEEKWPGIRQEELSIGAERIHTDAIYYDLYCPSDYTMYLTLNASEEYFKRMSLNKKE